MKINKFKKVGPSKYRIELDNKETLELYEEVIIKYNLLYTKCLEIDKLNEMLEFNNYSKAYEESVKFISKKMHCKKEIKEFLSKNSYNSHIIDAVIKRLEENNLINEENYVKSYINDKINLTKDGPNKIRDDLEKKGIDPNIIYMILDEIDKELINDKIRRYVEKRKKLNTKYSIKMMNNKITQELLNLGFDLDAILTYIDDGAQDDGELIKKEFNKAKLRYSKKYTGIELNQKIKAYLYSKGFSISDINNIISSESK